MNWIAENSFDYLEVLSKSSRLLVQSTSQTFKLPNKGLVILFDVSNYEDFPDDSLWRNLGNHLNIKSGDSAGIELPPRIEEIINSMNYSHLIWLAKRAWDTTGIDFVWNLAHELRHLEQDLENHDLALAGNFIFNNLKKMEIDEPKIQITVPTEMDAELVAWQTAQELFGKQAADSYVHNNANVGKDPETYRELLKHKSEKKYYVYPKTVSFLRKYQTQFDDIICQDRSFYSELGTVDELCRKLENFKWDI